MICSLCKDSDIKIIYNGKIRNGRLGQYTDSDVKIYQCMACNVIWHKSSEKNLQKYYESVEYRQSLEGSSEEDEFYRRHDGETLDKFLYTGTAIYRGKTVADIGCGCGAFLDFLKGVASSIVAVEPSEAYRKIMQRKGFVTYPYAGEAMLDWAGKLDVITSFDVIEHVSDPLAFMSDIYKLLAVNGMAIIGTPTRTPIMRQLLGEIYDKKILFSTQHLWIFSDKSLRLIAARAGFKNVQVKYFQRYGLGNLMGWLRDKEPNCDINGEFITPTLDAVWKSECSENKITDYIVIYLTKYA